MSFFQAHTRREADTVVVVLSGDCDLRSRDQMTATLLTAVRSSSTVTVDLADVRFLDSGGLHALVEAHRASIQRAGSLYVVNATGSVATVLQITGIHDLLQPPAPASDATVSEQVDRRD
jgi:anti-sigma B factor antagonist